MILACTEEVITTIPHSGLIQSLWEHNYGMQTVEASITRLDSVHRVCCMGSKLTALFGNLLCKLDDDDIPCDYS